VIDPLSRQSLPSMFLFWMLQSTQKEHFTFKAQPLRSEERLKNDFDILKCPSTCSENRASISSLQSLPVPPSYTMTTARPTKRARTAGPPTSPPSLPLPSNLNVVLDSDVTSHILSFLDGPSFVAAAAVSRAFRDAIIPRQRNVTISSFLSYESMKQMNFSGASFFSGRDSSLVTNQVLADLSECFPNLKSVDLSGCENINLNGIKQLMKGLGSRLERFVMIRSHVTEKKSDQRVTEAIIKAVSKAMNLQSLKLILPIKCGGESLQILKGKSSLRKESLMFSGSKPISLPRSLPKLEHLSIWTDFKSGFEWTELMRVKYPNLKALVVTDCQVEDSPCPRNQRLSAETLIAIMSKSSKLESLTIRLISPWSKLHLDKANQTASLGSFMNSRGIHYTGPSFSNWRYY